MRLVKTYFSILYQSATSLEYYSQVIAAPLSFSLKFFVSSTAFYAVMAALYLGLTVLMPLKGMLSILPTQLADIYPKDLEITINQGQVSTNVAEPYYLSIEKVADFMDSLKHQIKGVTTAKPTYFLVIDTTATADDFFGYQTFILITKNNLVYYNDAGRAEIVPLADVDGFTLNHQLVETVFEKLVAFFKLIWPLLIFLLILIFLAILPIALFSLVLGLSVILVVFAQLIHLKLQFTQVMQIVMHLSVPILLFTGLLHLIGLPINLRFYPSLLTFLTSLIVILNLREKSLTQTSA